MTAKHIVHEIYGRQNFYLQQNSKWRCGGKRYTTEERERKKESSLFNKL